MKRSAEAGRGGGAGADRRTGRGRAEPSAATASGPRVRGLARLLGGAGRPGPAALTAGMGRGGDGMGVRLLWSALRASVAGTAGRLDPLCGASFRQLRAPPRARCGSRRAPPCAGRQCAAEGLAPRAAVFFLLTRT